MKQEYFQLPNDIKIVCTLKLFFYKNHFLFIIFFFSLNPNRGYGYQRRLFSGNLPGKIFVGIFYFYRGRLVYKIGF